MEQFEQNIEGIKQPAMAIAGGVGAALVVATLPHVYLENIVGATGLSEIIAAAAPPLGNTARGLIAVMAGLVAASAIYFFINRNSNSVKGDADMGLALPKFSVSDDSVEDAGKAKFSMPKFSLKKLLQKPKSRKNDDQVKDLADLPKLREADSHPDAPARRPIFAEADLGAPLAEQIKPFEQQEEQQPVAAPETPVAQVTPAPFLSEKSLPVPPAEEQPLDFSGRVSAPEIKLPVDESQLVASQSAAEPKEDMSSLSIAQLADRLESGLECLKQLEIDSRIGGVQTNPATPPSVSEPLTTEGGINVTSTEEPVHMPPPLKSVGPTEEQVQETRQADMDAALKAALGTLEKMTAQR
ncbi:hypothetical protein MNBD_ALPHA04-1841 [hydrothermal vent metagenome]|uniref:Uncharacterized protein n=1 Tax=hydrothermal vent metagenome TaxID=652676 RepID=A0A3B0SMU4_9ZZZZ